MKNKIYKNVTVGKDSRVDEGCILGIPLRGKKAGRLSLKIGAHSHIRPFTCIYAGTKIGRGFQTGIHAIIREDNVIGNGVSIGTRATMEHGNRISDNVRIHTGCFLELAVVEENVFIGPHVIMLSDPHPPCSKYESCVGGVKIHKQAKIGGGEDLLPGVTIGRRAQVGAVAVVKKDVPEEKVVVGIPGRVGKCMKDLECTPGVFRKQYEWDK